MCVLFILMSSLSRYYFSECVHLLLAHNAPVAIKNLAGWSPLNEAISYGDRQTSKRLL
jgi:ankyrin repeat protein